MYGLNTAPSRPRIGAFARFLWKGLLCPASTLPPRYLVFGQVPPFLWKEMLCLASTLPPRYLYSVASKIASK